MQAERIYSLARLKEMLNGDDKAVNVMLDRLIKTIPFFLTDLNLSFDKKQLDLDKIKKILYNLNLSFNILGISDLANEIKFFEDFVPHTENNRELREHVKKVNLICNDVISELSVLIVPLEKSEY